MSFGWTAATWAAIQATAVSVGAAAAVGTGIQQYDNARHTGNVNRDAAKKNAMLSDEANNRANAKGPDTAAAMAAAMAAGKAGNSGTMLTGPSGIDPSQLTLGKPGVIGG